MKWEIRHFGLSAAMLLALVAAGCSDDAEEPAAPQPDAVALADGATVTASPEGGEVALRFTANKEWNIEIPEHFDRLLEFEHDARYEYRPDTGTFTDRGYGWWYPGEPDKMAHRR